jgi:anti-anti-sigma factor
MHQSIVIHRLPHKLLIRFVDLLHLDPLKIKHLQEQIIEAIQSEVAACVIVNLEKVSMLSSQTLNVILHMHFAVQNRPHKIRLCHVSRDAHDVFHLTRTDKFFEIFPNEEAAISS